MTSALLSTTHDFYWNCREPVPIGEVAETLLALERIVYFAPKVLEGLTNIAIDKIDVYVDAVESSSLTEKVLIKIFFKDEATLDAFLDKAGDHLRKPGMPRNALIGAILAAIIGYGTWLAAKISNPAGQATISGNNVTIINVGAGQLELTPEAFKAIVAAAIGDQKALVQETVKLFKPARSDKNASLVIDENPLTSFPPEVIKAIPKSVNFPKQDRLENISDVDLEIRAMDLDSYNRGWAAIIPNKIDRRVRLKLDPSIQITEISDKFSVRGDVSVYYKLDRSGKNLIPDYILLRRLVGP